MSSHMPPLDHEADWRLFAREAEYEHVTTHQANAPGYGSVASTIIGWNETWYCTRCRHVETVFVEREEAAV